MNIDNVIWLPDGKGFLCNASKLMDLRDSLEGSGLYYYSLDKKKSVRLARLFYLGAGGFVVPSTLNIKLPDTARNKKVLLPEHRDSRLIKICRGRSAI